MELPIPDNLFIMPTTIQLPSYFCTCGAKADTPKKCCGETMQESKDEFITRTTATPEELVEQEQLEVQQKIEQEAQRVKEEQDKLYKEIGELELLKLGGKTGLDAEITELKSKLTPIL